MKNSRLTLRYAKSLLALANESGDVETCVTDLKKFVTTCDSSKELSLLLKSPIIKTDKKLSILTEVFSDFNKLTKSFISIITLKKRENILKGIAERFLQLYKKQKGIQSVRVTSAQSLSDEMKNLIKSYIKNQVSGKIELIEKIDNKLIGGVIIHMDDKQLDISVLNQINNLKQTFNKNLYVKDF